MKLTFLSLFIASLLVTVFGCKKDCPSQSSALKNSQNWAGVPFIYSGGNCCKGNLSFSLDSVSVDGITVESVSFGNVPFEIRRFLFSPHSATNPGAAIAVGAFYSTVGGDLAGPYYSAMVNDSSSFIEITEIDGDCVKGFFQGTFILDSLYLIADPSLPDTIRFENGTFELN